MTGTEAKYTIAVRGQQYGDSWSLHGRLLKPIGPLVTRLLSKQPKIFFPWNLIFNKLLRALTTPLKRDHWVDIQGYAELVLNYIDSLEEVKAQDESDEETVK